MKKDVDRARRLARLKAYVAARPAQSRRALARIRQAIRSAAPSAVETFSYGIPAFQLHGRMLVWYAAWREHASLYPITDDIKRAHAAAIKGYKTSKGTIRFPLEDPIPTGLVKRLVKARATRVRAAR